MGPTTRLHDPLAPEQAPNGPTAAERGVEQDPLSRRILNPRTAASFALGLGICVVVLTRMNVEVGEITARLARADPRLFLLALGSYYLTFVVRAYRWRKLLRNVGYLEWGRADQPSVLAVARIILLSWFANCIVPAKLGDVYRAYLLKQRQAGISWSRTMGTILAERVIDMLLVSGLLGLSVAIIYFQGAALDDTVRFILLLGLLMATAIVVALLSMQRLSGLIRRFVPHRFLAQYDQFQAGTLLAFSRGRMPMIMVYSLVCWGIEASRLYLVCLALGVSVVNWPVILFVALAAALLTTLPITPAGLGFVESAIVGLLLLAGSNGLIGGIDYAVATSVAILDRSISYWSLVVVGLVFYVLSHRR